MAGWLKRVRRRVEQRKDMWTTTDYRQKQRKSHSFDDYAVYYLPKIQKHICEVE